MPFVSRASLGQEFYDIVSAQLLIQPEPQYLHAQLMKMALFGELDVPESFGLAGRGGIGGSGADILSVDADRLMLEDEVFSGAITVVTELGKTPGHTVRMNRPVFTNTTYTQASREVANGATISTTPVNTSEEQTSITLRRFFGPYDAANSRVAPMGVDRFDASMPVHKIARIVGKQLKRDRDKFLDSVGVLLFDAVASGNVIYPRGMTANNDSTVQGDYPFDFETLLRTEKKLDDLGIPVFPDGKRMMLLNTQPINDLAGDTQFARSAVFAPPQNPILGKMYYKSVNGFHIFKSTTLTTASNSSSVSVYYGQAFGPGMVGIGSGRLADMVTSTADNFGEHALVGWMAYEGFQNLDSRFGVSIRST